MRLSLVCLIAIVLEAVATANPMVFDSERRPTRMLSERVSVAVGPGSSFVVGDFRFQKQPPVSLDEKHVTIFVPVLIPKSLRLEEYRSSHGLPRVEVGRWSFAAAPWNDILLDGTPPEVPLPRGWHMQFFVCNVPLRYLEEETFQVRISYVQPHLGGDVSGYVPLRPPEDASRSGITFKAGPGFRLRRVALFPCLAPKRRMLHFTPRDRKLIRVQVVGESRARDENAKVPR